MQSYLVCSGFSSEPTNSVTAQLVPLAVPTGVYQATPYVIVKVSDYNNQRYLDIRQVSRQRTKDGLFNVDRTGRTPFKYSKKGLQLRMKEWPAVLKLVGDILKALPHEAQVGAMENHSEQEAVRETPLETLTQPPPPPPPPLIPLPPHPVPNYTVS